MKKLFLILAVGGLCTLSANAQFGKIKTDKVISAAQKGVKSFTLTDAELKGYADEATKWEDEHNKLCKTSDKTKNTKAYADRLNKIKKNIPQSLVDKYNLDIQAYYVTDVNAFARPNGTIRVMSSLMDIMTDDQILGVIGHEIGHVVNNDSKDAFATALRMSALKDAAASASGSAVASLTDSQLGDLTEALANAQFSQKQESAADQYGYQFLKECNIDPSNMASSLATLLALQDEAGSADNSSYKKLFSSHPDLKKRIEKLNKK